MNPEVKPKGQAITVKSKEWLDTSERHGPLHNMYEFMPRPTQAQQPEEYQLQGQLVAWSNKQNDRKLTSGALKDFTKISLNQS